MIIAAKGGVRALVRAMRDHGDKWLLQQYGAIVLRNLTLHNAANKVTIAEARGIETLVAAMSAHFGVATV